MFETESPELWQKQMWNIGDVVDGFLIGFFLSGKAQKNVNLIDLEKCGDSP